MKGLSTNNLDYLAAKLHARHSRMAEGNRLDVLCQIRSISELARSVGLEPNIQNALDFQRRLVEDLVHELDGFVKDAGRAGGEFLSRWLLRFQIENVKVLVRGLVNKISPEELQPHLVSLPGSLALDLPKLISAGSLGDLVSLLPREKAYQHLREVIASHNQPSPFLLEVALDSGYFHELLDQTRQLPGEDYATVKPLIMQEANFFQFMLVIRGRFIYGLALESLTGLRLAGIFDHWFTRLLTAPDMQTAAGLGIGIVLSEWPSEQNENDINPAALEALAWKRYLRLANNAFHSGYSGIGTVLGYAALRRVEVANLITISEGIRLGIVVGVLRARLIPQTMMEAAHV